MPETGAQKFARIKAERIARQAQSPAPPEKGILQKAWDIGNEGLVQAPARWGRQFSNWITTPTKADAEGYPELNQGDSPYAETSMVGALPTFKGAAGGVAEGVGQTVTDLTSPIGLATIAATGGGSLAARGGYTAASRGLTQGVRVVGGVGALHGGYTIGSGISEGDLGKVGAGALEMGGGAAALYHTPTLPAKAAPPPKPAGPTGTSFTSQVGAAVPPPITRMPPVQSAVGTVSSAPARATMTVTEPRAISSGMKPVAPSQTPPSQAAFEALVPNRYKTDVTPFGMTVNLPDVGPVAHPMSPRNIVEAREGLPLTPPIASTPPVQPPTAPVKSNVAGPKAKQFKGQTPDVDLPEVAATGAFGFDKYTPENLEALARRGNPGAIAEIARRKAQAPTIEAPPPVVHEPVIPDNLPPPPKPKPAPKPKVVPPPRTEPPPPPKVAAPKKAPVDKWEALTQELKKAGNTDAQAAALVARARSMEVAPPEPKLKPVVEAPKTAIQKAAPRRPFEGVPLKNLEPLITKGDADAIAEFNFRKQAGEIPTEVELPVAPKAEPPKIRPEKPAKPIKVSVEEAAAEVAPKPKVEGVPPRVPSKERPLAQAGDDVIERRMKNGDKVAEQEMAYRKQEAGSALMGTMEAALKEAEAKKRVEAATPGAKERTVEAAKEYLKTRTNEELAESQARVAAAKAKKRQSLKSETGEIGRNVGERRAFPTEKSGAEGRYRELGEQIIDERTGNNDPDVLQGLIKRSQDAYDRWKGTGKSAWKRLIEEETGEVGGGRARKKAEVEGEIKTGGDLRAFAGKAVDIANQARMTSMLSGLAVPKSMAGNIGSHFTAALENRSLKPIKALGDFGAIAKDIKKGWREGQNPALTAGVGKWNLPGRVMGVGDYAATESLKRAGLSEAAAKEILLTSPNALSAAPELNTEMGKLLLPFKTTPWNQFAQGLSRYKKHPGIYAGAVGAGVGAGSLTDDPEKLAMLSAFAGPYALPVLAGASMTAGSRALQGISPVPEWSIVKTLTNPAAPFTESPGGRWLEPGLGFGKKPSKSETKQRGGSKGKSSRRGGGRRGG